MKLVAARVRLTQFEISSSPEKKVTRTVMVEHSLCCPKQGHCSSKSVESKSSGQSTPR